MNWYKHSLHLETGEGCLLHGHLGVPLYNEQDSHSPIGKDGRAQIIPAPLDPDQTCPVSASRGFSPLSISNGVIQADNSILVLECLSIHL